MKFKLAAGLMILGSLSMNSNASVWKTSAEWTDLEEKRYERWVEKNWKPDMFTHTQSKYYGWPTDCADAAYTMRLLYSYENQLPFKIYSKKTNSYLSNEMTKYDLEQDRYLEGSLWNIKDQKSLKLIKEAWKSYTPEKKKLWLFNRLVNDITDTWTLPNDTISASVGREGIRPGMIFLQRRFHTYTIKEIDKYGNIGSLASTSPVELRRLYSGRALEYTPSSKGYGHYEQGILRFRWPNELKKSHHYIERNSTDQVELYKLAKTELENIAAIEGSEEETKITTSDIFKTMHLYIKYGVDDYPALSLYPEPTNSKVNRAYSELCKYTKERVSAVNRALSKKDSLDGQCMSEQVYNALSTPGRDKKIKLKVEKILEEYRDSLGDNNWENVDESIRLNSENILIASLGATKEKRTNGFKTFSKSWAFSPFYERWIEDLKLSWDTSDDDLASMSCNIEISEGLYLGLDEIVYRLFSGKLSSNPNASFRARWGFEEDKSTCSNFED